MDEDINFLRKDKEELRNYRRNMSLEDKIKELVKLQSMYIQIVKIRRPLKYYEKIWGQK